MSLIIPWYRQTDRLGAFKRDLSLSQEEKHQSNEIDPRERRIVSEGVAVCHFFPGGKEINITDFLTMKEENWKGRESSLYEGEREKESEIDGCLSYHLFFWNYTGEDKIQTRKRRERNARYSCFRDAYFSISWMRSFICVRALPHLEAPQETGYFFLSLSSFFFREFTLEMHE